MGKCIIESIFASWISVQFFISEDPKSDPLVKYAEIWVRAVNIKDLCLSKMDLFDSVTF